MSYKSFMHTFIMYAEDIFLMSISISDLQKLVNICSKELILIDLIINIGKSVCMWVGKRHNVTFSNIKIDNSPIEWKRELKYLGLQFVSASRIKCNMQISRQNFLCASNSIFGKIGTRSALNCYSAVINLHVVGLTVKVQR